MMHLKPALQALRPHQWAKNALVFVPMVLGGAVLDRNAVAVTALAFVALSLLASSAYIVNDLLDLEDDRRHWAKRDRPLARGALPVPAGIGLAAALMLAGLALGALAGRDVLGWLLAYGVVTLAYSVRLKRVRTKASSPTSST